MTVFTVADLFCGAGGLSLGFKWANFHSLLAADTDEIALQAYTANLRHTAVSLDLSCCDVPLRSATVIIGGPPCQGFSSAGARRNGDTRNSLVSCYAKIVARLRPRAFVFENVEGFLTAENGARIFDLLVPLLQAGYRIHLRKVNAANYGVPQHRKRVIGIGGLGFDPTFPGPTHTAFGAPGALLAAKDLPLTPTITEALADLPAPTAHGRGNPQGHFYRPLEGIDLERARLLKPGMTMRDLPSSLHHDSYARRAFRRVMDGTPTDRRGGAPAGVRRLRPDEPSKAITGGARSEFLHPTQDRALTIRECARLQTFPDDFEFCGTASQQGQLIGNAVPPLFASIIATALAADLGVGKFDELPGALLSFQPTMSDGYSPVLKRVTHSVMNTFREYVRVSHGMTFFEVSGFAGEYVMALSKTQRVTLTKIRAAGNSVLDERLDDDRCSYLLAVCVHDLEQSAQFPEIPLTVPPFFSDQPPSSLRLQNIEFLQSYERFLRIHEDAEAYFTCLAKLYKARLKYERILRSQPVPTLDQVGPRGLLQYGSLSPKALAGLLFWRKWFFDIDNRAGQETGYLFEPIIAHAIGGVPYGAKKSPIKRKEGKGGRQVDAICDEKRCAYEFKVRVTIAASGQGRWSEELSFPSEARASGYTPILVVLDPTQNEKLDELANTFRKQDGRVYIGQEAWRHLEAEAGPIMSKFIEKYVRAPLQLLLEEAPEKLPSFLATVEDDHIRIVIGDEALNIERQPIPELSEPTDELPEDADDELSSG